MKNPVYKEIRAIRKEGGDLYQKFADRHSISKEEAKSFLYPFLYGAGLSKIRPILTEREALEVLAQFNKLYQKTISKIETENPAGQKSALYLKVGSSLVKIEGE